MRLLGRKSGSALTIFLIVGAVLIFMFALTMPFILYFGLPKVGAVDKPTGGQGTTATAFATAYCPVDSTLEGGKFDRRDKPIQTIQDFVSGKASYVSVAMDSALDSTYPYGTVIHIPELDQKYNGGKTIEFHLVDHGGAFEGKGLTRIDIANYGSGPTDCPAASDNWENMNVTLKINGGPVGSASTGNDNVPLFTQTDPRWSKLPYGNTGSTIGSAGCCPTAAAMVLKFYGVNVDPVVIANYSAASGFYHDGAGTDHSSMIPALASKYGMAHGESLGTSSKSWERAKQLLQQGHPLIAAGKGSPPYSKSGHCIVLTGYDPATNQVRVNNPSPNYGNGPFPLSVIEHAHALYYLGN